MHPRNRHQSRYDFKELCLQVPDLKRFVKDDTIAFDDPEAVKMLNRALLKTFYGISEWDIPEQYLCPPIPGRVDYLHYIKDLIGPAKQASGLDIGVGANCIYPLLGVSEYGWNFVGSDADPKALASAKKNVHDNHLQEKIELRLQASPKYIFKNIIGPQDFFHFTMCNPPFHASAEEALQGTQRKWKNLGKKDRTSLNFGGQRGELWCEGGEKTFVQKMIHESAEYSKQCLWFTTLISKEKNLPFLKRELQKVRPARVEIINMSQGQKQSRLLAWSYQS